MEERNAIGYPIAIKNNKIIILLILVYLFLPIKVYSTSGCCSYHGGVDCSRKQLSGKVICEDGWTGSSCMYSSMAKCSSFFKNNIENENENYNDNLMLVVGIGGISGFIYFKNKKDVN